MATFAYGEMYPATPYGHVVASTEIVCGLAYIAILAGLTFVRFSRSRARLVFAANPVVATHNGKPTWMLRIGNGRATVLMDARAQLNEANAQVFVAVEARDPTLATTVYDVCNYAVEDIRFGMRYADDVTTADGGTPVFDLTRIGAREPGVGDRPEPGWTEHEVEHD